MTDTPHQLKTDRGYSLAYRTRAGQGPTIVFLHGFRSDMRGLKASALDAWCAENNAPYVRFDCSGHGESGGDFLEGTIGQWKQDALDIIDNVTDGPLILVGSSMGGWLMLLTALERHDRMHALVGTAPAPDFTDSLLWQKLSKPQQKTLKTKGVVYLPSCYDSEPYPITMKLIDEARAHFLLGAAKIPIDCPVRLLHGMQDADVPWEYSLALNEKLTSKDVKVNLVMDGDHRLSEPKHLGMMCRTVAKVRG